MSMTIIALALASAAEPRVMARNAQPDEIVVEGRQTRDGATDFVDRLLPVVAGGQYGRFEDPICPRAIGVTASLGKEIADRIRRVARAANIDVAGDKCTPNLILITAADKNATVEALRKTRPLYVRGIGVDELNQLGRSERPFLSWQVTDVVGADGMPVAGAGQSKPTTDVVDGSSSRAGEGRSRYEGAFPRATTTVSASRLRSVVKPRVLASVVIVETGALANVTARQLADFALVRAMTPSTGTREEPPASSILGLFNAGVTPESGPQSVTWWDVSFLKALVNTRSDAYANTQKSEIRNHMVKEMTKVPAEQH